MKYTAFIFLLFCFFACKKDIETVRVTEYDGAKVEYQLRLKDSMRCGTYSKHYATGELFETSNFKENKQDGERKLFYKNGTTKTIEHYENGLYVGALQEYYENGVLMQEGNYVNNVLEGALKSFYPNGTLKEVVLMANNEENGPFKEYYDNGILKAEGNYLDGDAEQGLLKLYNASGQLEKTMNCEKGRCVTTWALGK